MKRHIDCAWLLEIENGIYHCCDSRSINSGKELNEEQIMQERCEFFHSLQEKQKADLLKSHIINFSSKLDKTSY